MTQIFSALSRITSLKQPKTLKIISQIMTLKTAYINIAQLNQKYVQYDKICLTYYTLNEHALMTTTPHLGLLNLDYPMSIAKYCT